MKLHVLGASGSGVTTLGKALAAQLHINYFDSDDYFWLPSDPPFTIRRNAEERNQRIVKDLNAAQDWVLGGSVINWGDNLFPKFGLVIFLYLPQDIRLERLRQREYERYGTAIEQVEERKMPFEKFMAWAADYDHNSGLANRTLVAHQSWLSKLDCLVLELNGDLTLSERMNQVLSNL